MWKVFPKLGMLKLLFLVFSVLFISSLILFVSPRISNNPLGWIDFSSALKLSTPVTFVFLSIVYLVGKWGWLAFWKCPVLGDILDKSVCPNLNGEWRGVVQSNYQGKDETQVSKGVLLHIEANLFGFNVSLKSNDGYQESKVVQSEIYKDSRTNTFYLSYIFEAYVPIPEESDDRMFEGAAKLEVVNSDAGTELKGTYWTNRAWQRGKNTAGMIMLSRIKS
jgi:hypothetical protein